MQNQSASVSGTGSVTAEWVLEEFAGAQLPDKRLIRRAQILMTQFGQQPTATIPQACGHWSAGKAAYRFFDNEAILPEQLLAPHARATVRRMTGHSVVLAVQDTTTLNYSAHRQTKGLGPIGGNADKTIGLCLHCTLAVSTEGEALGVLAARTWARDAAQFGSSRQSKLRNGKPVREKESQKWLESLAMCQQLVRENPGLSLVNVADREADIYEMFADALAGPVGVHVLVRMQHNRQLLDQQRRVWKLLQQQPVVGKMQVQLPRKTGVAARTATLGIRFATVQIQAPCLKADQPSLTLCAIQASEEFAPKGHTPILWRLLTTLPVSTAEQAMEKVKWYAQRWQIEVLHKVLKSGCRIEQRQLETAARLKRVLMLDLIVAWRVMQLSKGARQKPQADCAQWLEPTEWAVLFCYFNPGMKPPVQPPTLREAVRWIGQLGGFLARKSDGEPGPIVLWRGLQRLNDLSATWKLLKNCG